MGAILVAGVDQANTLEQGWLPFLLLTSLVIRFLKAIFTILSCLIYLTLD
jgi:hypothetical protein